MNIKELFNCPKCGGNHLELKREATYLYSYQLNSPLADNPNDEDELLPFLFDNREQVGGKEYVECKDCGIKFPYDTDKYPGDTMMTILKKAIRAECDIELENNLNLNVDSV